MEFMYQKIRYTEKQIQGQACYESTNKEENCKMFNLGTSKVKDIVMKIWFIVCGWNR